VPLGDNHPAIVVGVVVIEADSKEVVLMVVMVVEVVEQPLQIPSEIFQITSKLSAPRGQVLEKVDVSWIL